MKVNVAKRDGVSDEDFDRANGLATVVINMLRRRYLLASLLDDQDICHLLDEKLGDSMAMSMIKNLIPMLTSDLIREIYAVIGGEYAPTHIFQATPGGLMNPHHPMQSRAELSDEWVKALPQLTTIKSEETFKALEHFSVGPRIKGMDGTSLQTESLRRAFEHGSATNLLLDSDPIRLTYSEIFTLVDLCADKAFQVVGLFRDDVVSLEKVREDCKLEGEGFWQNLAF